MKDLFGIIKRNAALKKSNDYLRRQNLLLRLQMDILIDNPESMAAKKIKARILSRRREIDESIESLKN